MTYGNPGPRVEPPGCVPPRYGLLSVAEVEDVPDGHWLAGFHTQIESCDDLETRVVNCTEDQTPKETTSGLVFPESDAFTVVAPFKCSTGGLTVADAWGHAANRLYQGESRSLERVFWSGRDDAGNIVASTLGAAVVDDGDNQLEPGEMFDLTPLSGAVSITDGLALLESWAGEHMPCAPVVHSARGIATYLAERSLVSAEGQVMFTNGAGSRVAVGGGYLTSGPNGVAAPAGEAWMWVSGAVKVLRGPVFMTPDSGDTAAAVDRALNDVTVYAERNYAFTRGCGLAAIRVNLKSCCC